MAVPSYDGGVNLGVMTATSAVVACNCAAIGMTTGTIIFVQVLQDGTGADVTLSAIGAPLADLAGTTSAATRIGSGGFQVGSTAVAKLHLFLMRVASVTDTTFTINSSSGDDCYYKTSEFGRAVPINGGSTLAAVIENGGSTHAAASGTSLSIPDVGVTTNGPDRLAINVIGINDDNAISAFTGQTGGTWAITGTSVTSATGTDGSIGTQSAAMASAGTIDGGSFNQADAADGWGVVGFAFIGTTAAGPAVPRHGFFDHQ